MTETLKFIAVEKENADHAKILYDLLGSREHSISHQSMPLYEEHVSFVSNHPYRAWFLIRNGGDDIGSIYVTDQNTIGIPNLKDENRVLPIAIKYIQDHFDPLPPVASVRPAQFVMNVPTHNDTLKTAIEKMGGEMIQVTYRI